jgi:vacuolar-type H+-ATPase subunit F/Vma7
MTAGDVQTTLRCAIVGESDTAGRVRIAGVWDVEIYKEMVLAVKAVRPVLQNDDADLEVLMDLT